MSWFVPGDRAVTPAAATVGLLVDLYPPPQWHDAVRSLAGHAEVAVLLPGEDGADEVGAWMASSPAAPGLDRARATGKPVVVLAYEGAPPSLDVRAIPPVTPYVRSRWRRRFGLRPDLVVDVADIPGDLRPTALAVAAAVIVHGRDLLLEALAWGAPTVTDAATAEAAEARAGEEVVVGAPAETAALAAALAADPRRAAALGRAGRRLVERGHDPLQAATALRQALGLAAAPSPVDQRLDELWTPARARIRERAAGLVAGAAV